MTTFPSKPSGPRAQTAAELHLTVITTGAPEDALIELREIGAEPVEAERFQEFLPIDDLPGLALYITKLAEAGFELAVGAAPRAAEDGRKEAVTEMRCLWVDCDSGAAGRNLGAFALKPTLVVETGRGLHGYWRLSEPVTPERGEEIMRRLEAKLAADHCHDAGRVMRLAGTWNRKYGDPRPVKIHRHHPEAVYEPDEIEAAVADVDLPERTEVESKELPKADQALVKKLAGWPAALFEDGPEDGDRSKGLAHLAHGLREQGLEPDQAAALLGDADSRWGKFTDRADREQRLWELVGNAYSSNGGAPAEEENPRPFALALDQFIEAKSDTPSALVGDEGDNLIPALGLVLLIAKGGKGKTTLVIDQAFHLASGLDWLGFHVARALRVLFIENEGPREPFRHKIEQRRAQWDHPIEGAIFIYDQDWGQAKLNQDAFIERLNAFVAEHQVDLVIGDPLGTLGMEGVGAPDETRAMVERLQAAGLGSAVAWEVLHHSRKEAVADMVDSASGDWGGKPDSLLVLEKLKGNRAHLHFGKVRWSRRGERGAYILAFEPESESFEFVQEASAEQRDYAVEVEQFLEERGEWLTAKEIAAPDGIGANVDAVKDALESDPERFVSRKGDEVGRHPTAVVWELTRHPESPESPTTSQGCLTEELTPDSCLKESGVPSQHPSVESELTSSSESATHRRAA